MASFGAWFCSLLLLCSMSANTNEFPSSGTSLQFPGMFDSIYQFGDGFSDTGNLHLRNPSYGSYYAVRPYGITLPGDPTGRCSDGLLMIDYFASALDVPSPAYYLGIKDYEVNLTHGVNFALDGATATDGLFQPWNQGHKLSEQVQWFRDYLSKICSSPSECKAKLERSLFVVGGIGTNDYQPKMLEKSLKDAHDMIPRVVQSVATAVKEVIDQGAVTVVVPGLFPLGCMPRYHRADVDPTLGGCQEPSNEVARSHNEQLQQALGQLRREYPNVAIHYGDYYRAYIWLIENAASLGFEKDSAFNRCCGGDGPCGFHEDEVCPNPKKSISWDGSHLTQEANRIIAHWILSDIFTSASTPSPSPSPSPLTSPSPRSRRLLRD